MKHTKDFLQRVEESNIRHNEHDFSQDTPYSEKCHDVKTFLVASIEEFEKREKTFKPTDLMDVSLQMFRKCAETKAHMAFLLDLLEKENLNTEILRHLYHSVHFAAGRDYVKATHHYMEVAIGKNPWPIGVTMVGVHERAGRSRIFTHVIKRRILFLLYIR